MSLEERIFQSANDAERLEDIYSKSVQDDTVDEFRNAINKYYKESGDNLLFAAWHFRLESKKVETQPARTSKVNWLGAVLIAALTSMIFWAISNPEWVLFDDLPVIILFWAPIAAIGGLSFLGITSKQNLRRVVILGAALLLAAGYVILLARGFVGWKQEHYLILMVIHIPLLAWISLGYYLLGTRSNPDRKFAFLIKSVEVIITAGLFLGAGMVFGMITIGLFEAIGIHLNEVLMRLIIAGGVGLLPVLALATIYAPTKLPDEQDFE